MSSLLRLPDPTDADFTRSLYTQKRRSPTAGGITGGIAGGGMGALVGAALAKAIGAGSLGTAAGAGIGGGLGGLAGLLSGRSEASRTNDQLLALRRLGVNSLAELHALEAYPGTAGAILKPKATERTKAKPKAKKPEEDKEVEESSGASEEKAASGLGALLKNSPKLMMALKGTGGGAAGYGVSKLYDKNFSDPFARKQVNALDAATGVMMALNPKGRAEMLKKGLMYHALPVGTQAAVTLSDGSRTQATATSRLADAYESQAGSLSRTADAAKEQAAAATKSVASSLDMKGLSGSSAVKGLGAGAGLAALAGLASGALRRRSLKEEKDDRSRSDMMASDMGRLLLPGAALGGLGGFLLNKYRAGAA